MSRESVLITYPDRLAGSVDGLRQLLDGPLGAVFAGVHLLPFFTPIDGADAGFDPRNHREVDPRVGTWDDVRRLGESVDVWADLIVNHVSDESEEFLDWTRRGPSSPWAGMFHTLDTVFPGGADEAGLTAIFRPRPGLPLSLHDVGGRPRLVWTTFTEHQVDLNLAHPAAWSYVTDVLRLMARHGVRHVRLDAVGYAAKTPGTSCFLTPDTYRVLGRLTDAARALGLQVLAEVHAHHRHQVALAPLVDRVYDFALPPLVLHAVHAGDVRPLLHWLRIRPTNAVTVLDTHDGIGVMDVAQDRSTTASAGAGLLSDGELGALVEAIHNASGGVSARATGRTARNVDIYQVNCTWYDAVGRDDARMCLSRLIQLLTPGVPHIYYMGLLAGVNDVDLFARTGVGRDVNRHHYRPGEIAAALRRPVVAATLAAIRLRDTHPAFDGHFSASAGDGDGLGDGNGLGDGHGGRVLVLRWENGPHQVELVTEPGAGTFTLTATTAQGTWAASTVSALAQAVPGPRRAGHDRGTDAAGDVDRSRQAVDHGR